MTEDSLLTGSKVSSFDQNCMV